MKLSKSDKLVLLPNTLDPNSEQIELVYEPGYPNVTFKIPPRIIYHYTSFNNAKNIIEGRCLKFSSPETINDPLDLYEGLVDFKCHSNRQIRDWVDMMLPKDTETAKRDLRKQIETGNRAEFAQMARDKFAGRRRISGVCCFSKESNVALMWSHYADKQTGICLEFELLPVGVHYHDTHMNLRVVNYIAKIEPVNYYSNMVAAFDYWINSKSNVWDYEKEVRAFINDRHNHDLFPFHKTCLKEIYFGCQVNAGQRHYILNVLKNSGYEVDTKRKMIIDPSIYSVKAIDL